MATIFSIPFAPPPRTFRPIPLILALASFAIVVTYLALDHILTDPPFAPPDWLTSLYPFVLIPGFVAPIAGILAITAKPFRDHTPRKTAAVIAVALIALATPLLAIFEAPPRQSRSEPTSLMAANLRGLAQACTIYAADHHGHFPPHPAILLLNNFLTPRYFSNYDIQPITLPNPLPPESSWPTLAAELDRHSAFTYTAADLLDPALQDPNFTPSLDPAIIVAYTKKSRLTPNRRIVAFADAHSEIIQDLQLPATFAASNAARAKLHLPPITLDGPPPVPPK